MSERFTLDLTKLDARARDELVKLGLPGGGGATSFDPSTEEISIFAIRTAGGKDVELSPFASSTLLAALPDKRGPVSFSIPEFDPRLYPQHIGTIPSAPKRSDFSSEIDYFKAAAKFHARE